VSPGDRGGLGERSRQALGEQARARRRHAAVDGGKERSAALAGERAHELEIAAGRLIDRERRSLRLAHGRRERRAGSPPPAPPPTSATPPPPPPPPPP